MSIHYGIIIIGTGPGGGTLAYKLAPSGKKILLLERGGYLPREKDNWSSKSVFIDNKYKAKETWKDKDGGTFHPGIHYNVGGNSKVYGAALLRMRQQDFSEVKNPARKSGVLYFIACFTFVVFIVIHVLQVILTGFFNNIRSMVTGWFVVKHEGANHEA